MESSKLVSALRIARFVFWLPVWFLGSATLSIVLAQEPKSSESDPQSKVPFRRIFIPAEEVNDLDLDGYEQVSAQEFKDYLEGGDKLTFSSLLSDSAQGTSLLSSYYVARLIGPDLFSERSKLVLPLPARSISSCARCRDVLPRPRRQSCCQPRGHRPGKSPAPLATVSASVSLARPS